MINEKLNAYIIESGSNANGNYVKYADGTLIQYGNISKDDFLLTSEVFTTIQNLNIYRSAIVSKPFPVNFIDNNYSINAIARNENDYSNRFHHVRFGPETSSSNRAFSVQLLALTPFTSTGNAYTTLQNVRWYAIGRWKE